MLVGVERLSMSQREGRVHVRSLVGAMSSYFLSGDSVSVRMIRSVRWKGMCSTQKLKKTSLHTPYQWLSGGPYSLTPQQFSVRHTWAQFLRPPTALGSVYMMRLSSSNLTRKVSFILHKSHNLNILFSSFFHGVVK